MNLEADANVPFALYAVKVICERVNTAAGKLNYYCPNNLGGLQKIKSNTYGIVIPRILNEINGTLIDKHK